MSIELPSRTYLDWAATAPLSAAARHAMEPFLRGRPGNASSVHGFGRAARSALEEAREQVASALGARPGEIVFTSGGTEADNLAVLGAARAAGPGHVVVSGLEHAAVLQPAQWLERTGWSVTVVSPARDGRVDAAALAAAIRPDTILVALMAVNNEIGTVQPVAEAASLARAAGASFFCDAVQALGCMRLDVRALGVDLLAVSAHKVGGPQGAGALYVREGVALAPLLLGGAQESQRRGGTENVAALVGMGAAVAEAASDLPARRAVLAATAERLHRAVRGGVPEARLVGHAAERAPHIACYEFPGADAETLLFALDLEGIAASSGAACSSHTLEPSHVLLAMGMEPAAARSCLRFSWGPATAAAEVDRLAAILPTVVERNRAARGRAAAR